jgi:hypothetical protein
MRSRIVDGYYRYSYGGDLYGEQVHWNLAASVFAIKIYYTFGLENNRDINVAANYIKIFRRKNGMFYDWLIFRKSAL